MKTLSYVNFIISILFMACYAYQAVYLVAALLKKQKVFKAKKLHRYGVLIAARNEEAVIAQLIRRRRVKPVRSFTSATIRMPWAKAMRCVSYWKTFLKISANMPTTVFLSLTRTIFWMRILSPR